MKMSWVLGGRILRKSCIPDVLSFLTSLLIIFHLSLFSMTASNPADIKRMFEEAIAHFGTVVSKVES